ncbi:hypothetical protein HYC85_009230 [Camellia sinensis]|uniref:Peptidase M3A/M3B catalytic domain-containing protein n=1 Tax=Camellia sinensis TaxID=4442 RepID=A0A7J7HHB1_CAMSI|nr:hypothetical protein HYC85_009230 [Camellia sinensis]
MKSKTTWFWHRVQINPSASYYSHSKICRQAAVSLPHRNIDLVYGGGRIGLMGLISQAVHDGGRHVIGVIPKTLMPQERIEEQQFNLDLGALKQYFPFNLVMSGILKICQDLFDLRFEEIADAEIPVALLTSQRQKEVGHTMLLRFSEVIQKFDFLNIKNY